MLTIRSLSHFIGGRTLYEGVNAQVKPTYKIGLVGRNGSGKSTLLRMLAGELSPSQGHIEMSKETTIGFLNQDLLDYQTDAPIRQVAMQAFQEALALQQEIDKIVAKLEETYDEAILDRLSDLQDRFHRIGGYDIESKTDQMLEKMGFSTADLHKPFSQFSGGWRMRVMFAKLLLEEPSILLLDEPTNHLDIVSIQWVESYLSQYPNAVIIVSHDRSFLDGTTNLTWEVTGENIEVYKGNYTFFEKEKAQRMLTQENAYRNQQKEIKRQQGFINQFRAKSSKASLVQSRIKALNKMEKVDPIVEEKVNLRVRFVVKQPSGKQVVKIEGLCKAFDNVVLFDQAHAHINRGDKIALIGMNGRGKSTLLKLIAATLPVDQGIITLGHNVTIGYHTQHQLEALNPKHTILESLREALPDASEGSLRATLGAFLFRNDDVHKPIKVLSGGEKARVALAKLLAQGPNFLLLDEPTNHLDMVSIDVLKQALQRYEGTLIFVSHNRYLVQEVAKQIWYIQAGQIKEYHGSYDELIKEEDKL